MTITKTYVRWEAHQRLESGKWSRIASSKSEAEKEGVAELRHAIAERAAWNRNLRTFIDTGKEGQIRIAKCTVEVTDISPTEQAKP